MRSSLLKDKKIKLTLKGIICYIRGYKRLQFKKDAYKLDRSKDRPVYMRLQCGIQHLCWPLFSNVRAS